MELTIHVPDDVLESVKDRLPPPELGVLETVALDAVLDFLLKLDRSSYRSRTDEPTVIDRQEKVAQMPIKLTKEERRLRDQIASIQKLRSRE